MPHVRRKLLGGAGAAALVATLALLAWAAPGQSQSLDAPMPEFHAQRADAWINSPPLHARDLKGKVVLLDVFASG